MRAARMQFTLALERARCERVRGGMNINSQLDERPAVRTRVDFVPALFIVGVWSLQFISVTAQQLLMGESGASGFLAPRFLTACVGIAISAGILKVHEHQSGKPLIVRALTGLGLALAACPIHSAANFGIFQIFLGDLNMRRATLESYLSATAFWFWCYFAISSLLLALVYSRELGEREREFAKLERLAQAAQIKALRYQINPHFMFNTLNSIAALVSTRQNETAEHMVESLGDFLRATLAIDPQEDHRLDAELDLQKLYLGIEQLRFPDRISTTFDIQPASAGALVPSLILQPLTENVIRHCVAVSSGRTELVISSRTEGDRLIIRLTNSPPEGQRRDRSTGVGLKNVGERLRARFGDSQRFDFGKLTDGCFQVELQVPLSFDEAA
jgi:two-component system, LytTR family, sensor kinase